MYDKRDREQVAAVVETGNAILQCAIDLGGTISGEHGIGWEKRDAMTRVYSTADLATMGARARRLRPRAAAQSRKRSFRAGRAARRSCRRDRDPDARHAGRTPKPSASIVARCDRAAKRSRSSAATRSTGMGFPPEHVRRHARHDRS